MTTPTPQTKDKLSPCEIKKIVLVNIRRCFASRRCNAYSRLLLRADYNDLREIIRYYRSLCVSGETVRQVLAKTDWNNFWREVGEASQPEIEAYGRAGTKAILRSR